LKRFSSRYTGSAGNSSTLAWANREHPERRTSLTLGPGRKKRGPVHERSGRRLGRRPPPRPLQQGSVYKFYMTGYSGRAAYGWLPETMDVVPNSPLDRTRDAEKHYGGRVHHSISVTMSQPPLQYRGATLLAKTTLPGRERRMGSRRINLGGAKAQEPRRYASAIGIFVRHGVMGKRLGTPVRVDVQPSLDGARSVELERVSSKIAEAPAMIVAYCSVGIESRPGGVLRPLERSQSHFA